MSRNIKDIIDKIEKEGKTKSTLEQTVEFLREEIERMSLTIHEQKLLIIELKKKSENQVEIPVDIQMLKEMIISLRQDLIKSDKDVEILKQKNDELTSQLERDIKYSANTIENEELINANKIIVQLTEENDINQIQIESLKAELQVIKSKISENENLKRLEFANKQIEDLKLEIEKFQTQIFDLKRELEKAEKPFKQPAINDEELEEINKKILNLQEENTKLKRNLDNGNSTIDKLIGEIKKHKNENLEQEKDIIDKNIKINALNNKIESLKRRIIELKDSSKEYSEEDITIENPANLDDFNDINSNELINKSKEENKNLKNEISELKENMQELLDNANHSSRQALNLPNYYQFELFNRMFVLLEENNRKLILDSLFQDLSKKNRDIKRCAINILSEIKSERVYNIFKKMIHDDDWIIRLYMIKALSKFENQEIKEPLKELLNDNDVDVREAAKKVLDSISN
ncbi:MAG: HEAT repeat domain-containing protein [Promethearchaeota archaeon]